MTEQQSDGAIGVASGQDDLLAPMPMRPLGRTGWEASLLTLGGVKWETRVSEQEAVALIRRAIELGVNTIDTAAGYGNGESERRLGIALEGLRNRIWLNTKTGKRDAGAARREMDASLERLRTDRVDLMFVHALDDEADYRRVMGRDSVLRAMEEYRDAGHIRFIGVSGHWHRHSMLRIIREYPFDAILVPTGLFNVAYEYDYFTDVVPEAQQRGIAVLGMKVFGAGRVLAAASIEPYLRYALHQPIDTAVIGCDNMEQLEQTVRLVKQQPPALSKQEQETLLPEARHVTQHFERGEFNWVRHYRER